jgi:hypothetical protein
MSGQSNGRGDGRQSRSPQCIVGSRRTDSLVTSNLTNTIGRCRCGHAQREAVRFVLLLRRPLFVMGEVDSVDAFGQLRTDRDVRWVPLDTTVDQLDVDLALLRTECQTRASQLLLKAQTYRRHSWMCMSTVPAAALLAAPHIHFLVAKERRVERLRFPQRVRSRTYAAGVLSMYAVCGLFYWPSQYGFRHRAERMARLSGWFDGLAWDAGVARNEIRRGTFDASELIGREATRKEEIAARREEEADLAAIRRTGKPRDQVEQQPQAPPSSAPELEYIPVEGHTKDEIQAALAQQLMVRGAAAPADAPTPVKASTSVSGTPLPEEPQPTYAAQLDDKIMNTAAKAAGRQVQHDPYGRVLSAEEADLFAARKAAAEELSSLGQVWHRFEERRWALQALL